MKRPKRNSVREDRIHNEAIVDANGPEEQVMGWRASRSGCCAPSRVFNVCL